MSDFTRIFIETLHRYERPLVRYALSFTSNLEDARDIVQEVFIKLSQNHESLDQERIAPWLFTACRNRAVDLHRKQKRLIAMDPATLELESPPTTEPDPSETLQRSETAALLHQLIQELPARQQEAVKMKFIGGLDYKQISLAMNTSLGNVGYLIHHGVQTLRQKWSVHSDTPPPAVAHSHPAA